MSLDTVIKIGEFYRQDKNAWKFHEQINHVMKEIETLAKNKNKEGISITTTFYEIPVIDKGDEFFFEFENIKEILDEDKKNSLYYLNFKANKKDSFKKYLVGDLVYSCYIDKNNKIIEGGNYRLKGQWEGNEKSSFWRSKDIIEKIDNLFILKFRREFQRNIDFIENLISEHLSIVLHFSFDGMSWHEQENIVDTVDKIIIEDLVNPISNKHFVLKKYLYKNLAGEENPLSPNFDKKSLYKNRLFSKEEITNLLYVKKVTEPQNPSVRIGNIGIIAIPHSDKLTSESVINFFEREKKTLDIEIEVEISKEGNIIDSIENNDSDLFFTDFVNNDFDDTVKFDIVFISIPKSPAGVFADLIEISDVEKSLLIQINKNIREKAEEMENIANSEFANLKKPFHFSIKSSFLNILGDVTKEKKKFQSHLLKVLPQIFTDNYYEDPLLLSAFLEKTEYNIREGIQSFRTLKYDFYFLMNIQINNSLMKITESNSYALGKNLGIMAKQFASWRDDCPIKSFEKSYVGNLSRRTSSIEELVKFAAFINEKLVMHDKLYPDVKNAYQQLILRIKNFGAEKYNKYNCSLGFFTSYYETKQYEDNNKENN